tara:strand:- start:462 stop:1484 length:1023 start_codon:yes stop_codon:yes gene_type:complete
MKILVTGCAGFIGYHLSKRLLKNGYHVVGLDNLNTYYDTDLKKARLNNLNEITKSASYKFDFVLEDIKNSEALEKLFKNFNFKIVFNLAAQAGVRYSLENPASYINSNIVGFGNILEKCRYHNIKHLIYASSSSVYGGNKKQPFKEDHTVDHPISIYAASKKANELMAHTYSHLYKLPTTGLRFFTVYGPWGRPDMALYLFTKSILKGKPIQVFNRGDMVRDFTYIDDIVESLVRLIDKPPINNINFDFQNPSSSKSWAPYRIFNIGNSNPIPLMEFIKAIEDKLGIKAQKEFLEMQPGDVSSTYADTSSLEDWTGFKPNTSIKKGISEFVDWYKSFYKY